MIELGWEVRASRTTAGPVHHVMPQNDRRSHCLSFDCWCLPTHDNDNLMVLIHHSADRRELME